LPLRLGMNNFPKVCFQQEFEIRGPLTEDWSFPYWNEAAIVRLLLCEFVRLLYWSFLGYCSTKLTLLGKSKSWRCLQWNRWSNGTASYAKMLSVCWSSAKNGSLMYWNFPCYLRRCSRIGLWTLICFMISSVDFEASISTTCSIDLYDFITRSLKIFFSSNSISSWVTSCTLLLCLILAILISSGSVRKNMKVFGGWYISEGQE